MISEFNNAEQNRSEQTSQSLSPHSNFILIQAIKSDFAVVVDMCICASLGLQCLDEIWSAVYIYPTMH